MSSNMNKTQARKAVTKQFLTHLSNAFGVDAITVDDEMGGRLVIGVDGGDVKFDMQYHRSHFDVVVYEGNVGEEQLEAIEVELNGVIDSIREELKV